LLNCWWPSQVQSFLTWVIVDIYDQNFYSLLAMYEFVAFGERKYRSFCVWVAFNYIRALFWLTSSQSRITTGFYSAISLDVNPF
jgi:hypothetical protein